MCLTYLSIIFSKFIHVMVHMSTSFLCIAKYYSIVLEVLYFIFPFISRWVSECVYFLTITNNAAVNIHIQGFGGTCIFNSLGY